MLGRVMGFLNQSKRIFYMFYKPRIDEYKQILKVAGLGVIVIGAIGLIVYLVFSVLGL